MENRPLVLTGKVICKNKYIMGKIAKNRQVEGEEKKDFIQVLDAKNISLFEEGYKGYIFEKLPQKIKVDNYAYNVTKQDTLIDYDIIEMIDGRVIKVLYRDDSEDNVILATNQCNSNCIMCPDPDAIRNTSENPYIGKLIQQVKYTPNDATHITITGGEPGILKWDLIKLVASCKEYLSDTEFLLLSNGRVFADKTFTIEFKKSMPEVIRIGIPIYADNEELHDGITRAKGSFKQAIVGIKNLIKEDIDVEIRIVVMKQNYKYLQDIASFIANEIPEVKMVNIMALEMSGNAYLNREKVWIEFEEIKRYLYDACIKLISNGIVTNLYNFPLCMLNEKLYSISHRSITDYKIRYQEECEDCTAKDICGGFFNTTIKVENIKVKPIK